MRDILRHLLRYKGRLALGLLALLIVDGAQLVIPLILRKVVDLLALGVITPGLLFRYGLFVAFLALIIGVFRFVWRWFIMSTTRIIEMEIRNGLYAHIIKLSASFFNRARTGDLMAHATNDIDAIRFAMGMGLVASADAFIYAVFSLAIMITLSPLLTLYVAIPLVPLIFIVLWFGKAIHRLFERVQASFANLTERVREALSGIRVIKTFVQERGQEKAFREASEDFVRRNMELVKVWGMFHPLLMFLANISMGIVLLAGGRKVIMGNISLGDFVAFTNYIWMLAWPMMAIGWVVNLLQRGSASMKRINRILSIEPDIKEKKDAIDREIEGEIRIERLTFAYPGSERPVLRDITFALEKGKKLGIFGKTGSGKSTLVHLIPRIFDPPEGSLFIDGHDVRDYRLLRLRRSVGFVPQDSFLFSTSIRENIAFGKPDATEEEIIEAAKVAEIYDEIMEFPDGFDTVLGERGVTLSGGQKQRIALARAILLNPPILIIDDALSAVDTETEEKILNNLKKVMAGRTSIVISHRVKAIMDSDLIIVLDNGEIIERGTHEELLEIGGFYKELYELQMVAEKMERAVSE